jgi:Asp-tRNA(Asn)/Glu-tRNA(Gln) amidotransferase A subunit family amidase
MDQGMSHQAREAVLGFTAPASLAGHPVLSVPFELAGGSPNALQVILPRSINLAIEVALAVIERISAAEVRQIR